MLKKLISATATAVVLLPAILAMGSQPANAAPACQCTQYVANARGLTRNFPHAKDWNDGYLQRNGYRQIANPQPGAIVVMETTFPGANTQFGHVGFVERVLAGNRIEVRGANQYVGGRIFTEANCSNVRVTAFGTSVTNRPISFWVR